MVFCVALNDWTFVGVGVVRKDYSFSVIPGNVLERKLFLVFSLSLSVSVADGSLIAPPGQAWMTGLIEALDVCICGNVAVKRTMTLRGFPLPGLEKSLCSSHMGLLQCIKS
jgi:hypothetical protein